MSRSSSSPRSLVESSFVFVDTLNADSMVLYQEGFPYVPLLLGLQRQAICHSPQVIYGSFALCPFFWGYMRHYGCFPPT